MAGAESDSRISIRTAQDFNRSEHPEPTFIKPELTVADLVAVILVASAANSFAQAKKPNILIIWGDDIGWYKQSIYYRGDMEYRTPNSDALHDRVQGVTSAN